MTMALTLILCVAVLSFGFGLYYRVAEYDILASDKVWDRIAPAAQALVDDEAVPDSVAANVTMFAMMTGCGCFVGALLRQSMRRAAGFSVPQPSEAYREQIDSLTPDARHRLFTLLDDLVLFDSLHAPILGRLCRVLHRRHFSRSKYRIAVPAEREELQIVRIATAVETVVAKKADPQMVRFRELIPA